MRSVSPAFIILLTAFAGNSQSPADAAVAITAQVQTNPAQITLNWNGNATTTQYTIYRKPKSANFWGVAIASVNGTVTQYADNTVSTGVNYEYHIRRFGNNYNGYGYINCGIEVPETDFRGNLILIVDSSFVTPLSSEIKRLVNDIEGDGWNVIRHDVLSSSSVLHVKDMIVKDYKKDSAGTKAVFLLGHVPVPYSGNINPDGHPDHQGAWPADVFYGDMDGAWSDMLVSSNSGNPARIVNIPGDGKFDQSIVPGDVELQVGRVDMHDLPAFSVSEQLLLKAYLDKDHDYRKKIYVPGRQAVIDDNFGYFSSETFASSGYKNFAALVGAANVSAGDYFTTMSAGSYLWSYGCGGGSFTSAGGIGATSNFATSNLQGVFSMLFGSYFGDWDVSNNFLRAPLAQGKILTNVWSGRPHFQFHHMGLGENIGYSLLMTQNNPGGLYYQSPTNITGKWIHTALMGDPTLRNDIVTPVSNVVASIAGNNCFVNWSASTESNVAGYNIYFRSDSVPFLQKLNQTLITGTSYSASCVQHKGIYTYLVRAVKLENYSSGSYFNMSEGISDTALSGKSLKIHIGVSFQMSAGFKVTNNTLNADHYFWDFGNGITSTSVNPVVSFSANGVYTIMLVASNSCFMDTAYFEVTVMDVGIAENAVNLNANVFPNPASGIVHFSSSSPILNVRLFSAEGKSLLDTFIRRDDTIDLSQFPSGLYFLQIRSDAGIVEKKLILQKP